MQRKEKKKKEQDYASVSNRNGIFRREEFTQWSFETVEVYSYEDKTDGEDISGGGGKGLKVEEGQKLSQKQLQMLETAAEEKLEASTNPLCKNQNLFRFLFEKVRKHEQKIDLQESPINSDNHVWHFKDALQRKTAGAKRKGRKVCLLLFLTYNRCSLISSHATWSSMQ